MSPLLTGGRGDYADRPVNPAISWTAAARRPQHKEYRRKFYEKGRELIEFGCSRMLNLQTHLPGFPQDVVTFSEY